MGSFTREEWQQIKNELSEIEKEFSSRGRKPKQTREPFPILWRVRRID